MDLDGPKGQQDPGCVHCAQFSLDTATQPHTTTSAPHRPEGGQPRLPGHCPALPNAQGQWDGCEYHLHALPTTRLGKLELGRVLSLTQVLFPLGLQD